MLVVITIFVILLAMTITAVNVSMDRERIRSAARQMQSYIEGARDRAIFAKLPRGVRFLIDAKNPAAGTSPVYTVSSMIYVGATEDWTEGEVRVLMSGGRANVIEGVGTGWHNLFRRGLLEAGNKIKLGGLWYTVADLGTVPAGTGTERMVISPPLVDVAGRTPPSSGPVARFGPGEYRLRLSPAPLPNTEPVQLPSGIVIDLNHSELPPSWQPGAAGANYKMDLMFSPRGQVIGAPAAKGIIHFLLNDVVDTERGLFPVDRLPDNDLNGNGVLDEEELNQGDKLVVTVFPRTGYVVTSPVFRSEDLNANGVLDPGEDVNANGLLDPPGTDLFFYAERGEVER